MSDRFSPGKNDHRSIDLTHHFNDHLHLKIGGHILKPIAMNLFSSRWLMPHFPSVNMGVSYYSGGHLKFPPPGITPTLPSPHLLGARWFYSDDLSLFYYVSPANIGLFYFAFSFPLVFTSWKYTFFPFRPFSHAQAITPKGVVAAEHHPNDDGSRTHSLSRDWPIKMSGGGTHENESNKH